MKLNLLPTYVGKEKAVRSAIFLSFILAAAGVGAAVFMITSSEAEVTKSKQRMDDALPQAQAAVAEAKKADVIIQGARVLILNSNLAQAMDDHNYKYVDTYDKVRPYIPSYLRVTNMTAAPAGENTVVTLTGVLQTQQQYADTMLALLRIPGAISVSRGGYNIVEKVVPGLSEGSQNSIPIEPGAAPVPDDPLARMEYLMNQPRTQGFLDVGGFGTDVPNQTYGAMPNWSVVTFSVVFPGNIQTPNPRATLATVGAAGAPAGGGAPGGGGPPAPAVPAGAGADDDRRGGAVE